MDIDTATLNGALEEEFYLDSPEGISPDLALNEMGKQLANGVVENSSTISCLLIKALYGLKQHQENGTKYSLFS